MLKHSIKNRTKVSKKPENTPIYVEITFNCQRARYYPGFNIALSQWDKDTQSVIRKRNGKLYVNACGQSADVINQYLARVRVAVDNIFEKYEYEHKTPHPQYLLNDIRAELDDNKKDAERKTIFQYYDQFIEMRRNFRTESRIKNYVTRRNQLKQYGKIRYFEDFTKINLDAFVNWLICDRKYNNTYVIKVLQDNKVFLKWAHENGLNPYTDFENYDPDLRGCMASRGLNVFALTKDEIAHLCQMEIKQDYLNRVRDVFVFCSFTGLRYSDIHNLKWANVHDDCIQLVTIKTTDPLTINLNDVSRAMIEKYRPMCGIYADDMVFPVISNQKYNKYLKELGQLAGFNRIVTRVTYNGKTRIEKQFHAWELMTTHVGRKNFVSTAASLGIPDYIIRSCTGHKSSRAMQPYMKIYDNVKRDELAKMNIIATKVDSVFDFGITDNERAAMGIPERAMYETIIRNDKSIATLHLALLMHKRGDDVKSLEFATRLPDAMKVQYMQTILNAK